MERKNLSEDERREELERASSMFPKIDMRDWTWTDDEIFLLRKACAMRFGEDLRTESLMAIARAALQIEAARRLRGRA